MAAGSENLALAREKSQEITHRKANINANIANAPGADATDSAVNECMSWFRYQHRACTLFWIAVHRY